MELINNRYKIESFLSIDNFDNYIVKDAMDKNNIKCMRIIDGVKNKALVDFYMEEFIWIKNIRHRKILEIEAFGNVETINLKSTSVPLYYLITDMQPETNLREIKDNLSFSEIIKILQELIWIIDFLHFRGFSYRYLDPSNIYYSQIDGLKLSSLTTAIENDYGESMELYNDDFLAPSILIGKDRFNIKTDYYSLSMIMRYLLLDNYSKENSFFYKEKFKLGKFQMNLLMDIIKSLKAAYINHEKLSLLEIIHKLDKLTDEEFVHTFKEDRERLYYNTKLIGRDKNLRFVKEIHDRIKKNNSNFNGLMITGSSGVGKTRFIRELAFRLKIKENQVFRIDMD